jgi:hypothetical protein
VACVSGTIYVKWSSPCPLLVLATERTRAEKNRLLCEKNNNTFFWLVVVKLKGVFMSIATFAILPTKDIRELGRLKASGCAVLLYTALLSYARDKVSCFPSIKTLSEQLGGAYAESGIYKALKWLEDNKFIKRNERRSKQRFVMLRRLLKATSTKVESALCSTKVLGKKSKKNNFFFKKRQKQKSTSALNRAKHNDTPEVSDAESIFSSWVVRTEGKDITMLSSDDLRTIGDYLNERSSKAYEWREWMSEHWGDVFQKIKDITRNEEL